MIIDFHTHAFPDALAQKAIASLQFTAKATAVFDGTVGGLCRLLDENGIDKAVVLNTVTNEKQVDKVNAFALQTATDRDRLIPFCSVHPFGENIYERLSHLKSLGIKGIKHHPDYLGLELTDKRLYPLLEAASELSLPLVIHTGYDPVSPNKMHATPDMIRDVVKSFPKLKLVAAHLGGVRMWDEVLEKLCGLDIYFDTALCCERHGITVEQGKKIFSKHPTDRILFGSDAPWATPFEVLEFLNQLGLSETALELILHSNAEKLLMP